MDADDLRLILSNRRVDVWTLIDAAIALASSDYSQELKDRRDGIVEKLYESSAQRCRNCEASADDWRMPNGVVDDVRAASMGRESSPEGKRGGSPLTPQSNHRDEEDDDDDEEEEADPYGGLFDDEQTKVLKIKEQIEDPDQSEESLVELLQSLADMDITFKALKETDIGRNVNRLRKHSSNEVRRLVKQLVRKWKDLVDEWVRLNQPELTPSNLIADVDSPQQNIPKNSRNGHHQVPDFAYSPNPHNGSSGSERNYSEPEQKLKAVPKREAPVRPPQSKPLAASAPPNRSHKDTGIDLEKLNSARRRLHENYQEHENAKKQKKIQVMDIHEIPRPKNAFFAKNKGGFQGRHHR